MKQQHLIIIGISATIVLLLGGTILAYGLSQGGSLPGAVPTSTPGDFDNLAKVDITSPPSLSEIAKDIRGEYPELADLLENPELGSVYKDFYLAYQNGGREAAIALARQRNIINGKDEIVMTLVLDTEDVTPLVTELEREGVIVNGYYKKLINIAIPLSLIEEQAKSENPELIVERISNLEHVLRLEFPKRATIQQSQTLGQGVSAISANQWHAQGITGQGVKIGVLDLGFGGYDDLLGTELPSNVTLKAFGDDDDLYHEIHGTACAEIVHEIAPDAELYLAYYDGTDVAMGQAVEWLVEQGVDIISNSTNSIGTTPMDGTGFTVELVEWAYENDVFWVNSAGNYAERHYRGRFSDDNDDGLHDFGDIDKQVIPFRAGADVPTRIILSWDDWENVNQDYELILYKENGKVLAKSEEPQSGERGQEPVEGFLYTFDREGIYLLGIENYEARGDAEFDLFIEPSLIHSDFIVPEHSLGGPADAKHAFAVGATYWYDNLLEDYSSRGPTTDGRVKPDITAPDDVDSQSYKPESFPGTSAAAPHVAGASALVLQAFPEFAPDDIAEFLQKRSQDLGDSGPDNSFGAGQINLGGSPTDPQPADEILSTPIAEARPTSTPRPPDAPIPTFDEPGSPTGTSNEDAAALLGAIVLVGLCLVCLSALMFFAFIVGLVLVLL
jgi:subtilisin family serine protease